MVDDVESPIDAKLVLLVVVLVGVVLTLITAWTTHRKLNVNTHMLASAVGNQAILAGLISSEVATAQRAERGDVHPSSYSLFTSHPLKPIDVDSATMTGGSSHMRTSGSVIPDARDLIRGGASGAFGSGSGIPRRDYSNTQS